VIVDLRQKVAELAGTPTIQLRDGEHCPKSDGADVLLIEPLGTVNTGDAGGERTRPERGL
jgi:hypothetical protein